MSILSRARTMAAVAGLAIAVVVGACSSAATPAPTPAPTAAPAVATPSPAATAAPTASATATATASDVATASPSSGAALTAPPGTPLIVDPFTSAGIATTVDTAAHAVDPSTYRTTIPGKQYQTVYVVFALKPDAVGKVTMVMTFGDIEVANPLTIDYGTINSWGDFKINFTADGIPPGIYKAVMTYEPTGAQVVQYFAVTTE